MSFSNDELTESVETESVDDYSKVALHFHSCLSYDVPNKRTLNPEALYNKARRQGFIICRPTDHDAFHRWSDDFQQAEVTLNKQSGDNSLIIHLGFYGATSDSLCEIIRLASSGSSEKVMLYIRGHKELIRTVYNHPFYFEPEDLRVISSANAEELADMIVSQAQECDVIEINHSCLPRANALALKLAKSIGKQLVYSSDTHTGLLSSCYTVVPKVNTNGSYRSVFNNVWDHIINGRAKPFFCMLSYDYVKQEYKRYIDNVLSLSPDNAISLNTCSKVGNAFIRMCERAPTGSKRQTLYRIINDFLCFSGIPARYNYAKQNSALSLIEPHINRKLSLITE